MATYIDGVDPEVVLPGSALKPRDGDLRVVDAAATKARDQRSASVFTCDLDLASAQMDSHGVRRSDGLVCRREVEDS